MPTALRMRSLFAVLVSCALWGAPALAQMETATLSGVISDPKGAVVPDVEVTAKRIETGAVVTTKTNGAGIYFFTGLMPGHYHLMVRKPGFKEIAIKEFQLYVQDKIEQNFSLEIGSVSETVTVTAGAPLVNTQDGAVSTVVARQFVENMPLNGRSFQSLITLTPGVVLTKANVLEQGQFSVNGQRADANYFTIDGVSANIGTIPNSLPGQSSGGSVPGLSASGGTNNLVSVDTLQEFRVQTSTFAPEFGRTPGAHFSIVTRSGTNEFHGTLFEYFRNDILDANDWFANKNGIPKPALRQNDFGAVFGGPIVRNRTFFFFSYEGLRLRQPRIQTTSVPSLFARQTAPAPLQPFLNAFPLPNGPAVVNPGTGLPTGFAPFTAGFSDEATFNATSLRIDHTLTSGLVLFGRYNHAPSETTQRGSGGTALSVQNPVRFRTQTLTAAATLGFASGASNDFRFNHSRNRSAQSRILDGFGGAVVPADSVLFPSFPPTANSQLTFNVSGGALLIVGQGIDNLQRQVNVVDTFSVVKGPHQLKFGIDYRRLFPVINSTNYFQGPFFSGVGITAPGVPPPVGTVFSGKSASVNVGATAGEIFPVYTNLSTFAQDTWKAARRLTLTYGLRWELNPAPSEANGNDPFAVTGLDNPATATLAPRGTKLYQTTYNNFAPRVGAAYQLSQHPGREMVLRGGFGMFYDLGNQQAANAFTGFPFGANKTLFSVPYPLTPDQAAPPPINPSGLVVGTMYVFVRDLDLPLTYQWNVAMEQSLGSNQTIAASYVAAVGRRLVRQEGLRGTASGGNLNPAVFGPTTGAQVLTNGATSDYHALQLQFQRRLSRGLQAIASYTLSHSIDIASNDSGTNPPGVKIDSRLDRGPSDFDVRHSFSGSLTYDFPTPHLGNTSRAALGHWSVDAIAVARSATPVNITSFAFIANVGGFLLRPDLVPGAPLTLNDPTVAGGGQINPAAFSTPNPPRQGTLGRNALRGFRASQLDFAVRRRFKLAERAEIQFKGEFFNVFNHPNFGDPEGLLLLVSAGLFGHSNSMLARSLGQGGSAGGFNPLYQIGGARSIQFALKLQF